MQQRQLRLGDIVDDYCPRERRVTNHAIVAMVEQDVKQTRCTTCDTEHEYKQAKVPSQRKKKAAPGALYQEVLAGIPRKPTTSPSESSDESAPGKQPDTDVAPAVGAEAAQAASAPEPVDEVDGPVHRPLIRATLPRPEGQVPTRQAPEFTIRQPMARPGRFRPGGGGGAGRRGPAGHGANGSGFEFGGRRNAGAAGGSPHGAGNRARPAQGERQGPPQHRRRGGKKRSK